MAKTLKSLIEESTSLADETGFDNKQWVDWFNSALDDLAPVLYIDKKVPLAAVTAGHFTIPTDYISTIRMDGVAKNLRMLDPTDDVSTGYHMIEGEFVLQNDAATTISLWYYRRPAYFTTTNVNTQIDMPDSYLHALVYHACALGMMKEDESDRYDVFMNEYNKAKGLIQQTNTNKKAGRAGAWGVSR